MENKKRIAMLIGIVLLGCVVMAVVDGIVQPHYAVKSAIKIVLFLALPMLYAFYDKSLDIKKIFVPNKKGMLPALVLGMAVFFVILCAYMLLKDVFDFSAVTTSLTGNIGVNRENFVFVALYISFVNSLLEEFFFRGFAFLTLKQIASAKFAYIFSSLAFALYHVAMMIGWFSFGVFVLVLVGLFAGGLIFNYLNEKSNTIYVSWFVHMFANFAINLIGFILFGIL